MTNFFRELNRACIGPNADLPGTLRNLVEGMDWCGYAVWTYDAAARGLRAEPDWVRPDARCVGAGRIRPIGHALAVNAWRDGAVAAPTPAGAASEEVAVPVRLGDRAVAVFTFAMNPDLAVTEELRAELQEAGRGAFAHLYSMYRHTLAPTVLTSREQEVLQWSAQGHGTAQIAVGLDVAHSTIKTHFENLYGKLGVTDRAAAVAQGFRRGLIV